MKASQSGHDVVVETLLNGGATVDMQNEVLLYWPYHSFCPHNACKTRGVLVLRFIKDWMNTKNTFHVISLERIMIWVFDVWAWLWVGQWAWPGGM